MAAGNSLIELQKKFFNKENKEITKKWKNMGEEKINTEINKKLINKKIKPKWVTVEKYTEVSKTISLFFITITHTTGKIKRKTQDVIWYDNKNDKFYYIDSLKY